MAELFYRFDTLFIVITAVINAAIWGYLFYNIKITKQMIYPDSSRKFKCMAELRLDNKALNELDMMKKKIVTGYSFYANITAIFPLLGILGTVASLITISQEADMMDNLMVALDTTLLGVFFAIVFKAVDGVLSGPIDSISDDLIVMTQNYLDDIKDNGGSDNAE